MEHSQFQETRKSARLPSQRSQEEDNILGMLAVMAGYVNQKDPAFMEAISTNRTESILDRFVSRKLIKTYQSQAILLALEETSFKDSEKFGEVFCRLFGDEYKTSINISYDLQKQIKDTPKPFIGQILLENGYAQMNQIIETLHEQEKERTKNNETLLARIKFYEKHCRPNVINLLRQENPEAFWILTSFTITFCLILLYLFWG